MTGSEKKYLVEQLQSLTYDQKKEIISEALWGKFNPKNGLFDEELEKIKMDYRYNAPVDFPIKLDEEISQRFKEWSKQLWELQNIKFENEYLHVVSPQSSDLDKNPNPEDVYLLKNNDPHICNGKDTDINNMIDAYYPPDSSEEKEPVCIAKELKKWRYSKDDSEKIINEIKKRYPSDAKIESFKHEMDVADQVFTVFFSNYPEYSFTVQRANDSLWLKKR